MIKQSTYNRSVKNQESISRADYYQKIVDEFSGKSSYSSAEGKDATVILLEEVKATLVHNHYDKQIIIPIQCTPFIIGRDKKQVDLVLSDPQISRLHAQITNQNNSYYIEDIHSKNGTFHNGQPIKSHQIIELSDGDTIIFASNALIFKLQND